MFYRSKIYLDREASLVYYRCNNFLNAVSKTNSALWGHCFSCFWLEDFNISIKSVDSQWWSIPTLEAFVDTKIRGIWFNDADIEFEVEECGKEKFNCITVYEK